MPITRCVAAKGCAVDGCDRPHRAAALCPADYAQQLRGQDLRPLEVSTSWPSCTFSSTGCAQPGLQSDIRFEAESYDVDQALVGTGVGLAIVSRLDGTASAAAEAFD